MKPYSNIFEKFGKGESKFEKMFKFNTDEDWNLFNILSKSGGFEDIINFIGEDKLLSLLKNSELNIRGYFDVGSNEGKKYPPDKDSEIIPYKNYLIRENIWSGIEKHVSFENGKEDFILIDTKHPFCENLTKLFIEFC